MWRIFSYTKLPTKKPLSDAAKLYQRKHANPLFAAIDNGEIAIFRELVEHDPQEAINARWRADMPILYGTFSKRNLEMAAILLENGANPDVVVPFLKPPRLLIVEAVADFRTDFISLLIQHKASVDKEVNGFSVRKILDNPKRYVKSLFEGNEQCEGARQFLAKAQEMKQLVERLSPRPVAIDETPIMSVYPSATSPAMGQLRQRNLAAAPAPAATPSPAIPVM